MTDALIQQLNFFGFKTHEMRWEGPLPNADIPLAVLFMPKADSMPAIEHACIAAVRERCAASQLIYLGASRN